MNPRNMPQLPVEQPTPSMEKMLSEAQMLQLSVQRILELSRLYLPVSGLEA